MNRALARTGAAALLLFSVGAGCGSKSDSGGGGIPGPTIGPVKFGAIEPSKAVRAAVFLGSCIPDDRSNRILQTMYTERTADGPDARLFFGGIDCFAGKSNGCQAVADCVGVTVDGSGPCEDACNGAVGEGCDDKAKFRIDCSRYPGLTCNAGNCAPPVEACDQATFKPTCEDGVPTSCGSPSKGKRRGLHCADLGLDCTTVAIVSTVGCVGSEGACTASSSSSTSVRYEGIGCSGASLQACVNGGKKTLDCATIAPGFSCQSVTAGAKTSFFCGLAAECDPTDTSSAARATCDGTALVVCNAGKLEKVDCKTLGFTGCNAAAGVCSPSPW